MQPMWLCIPSGRQFEDTFKKTPSLANDLETPLRAAASQVGENDHNKKKAEKMGSSPDAVGLT